jgi:glutamate-ammonia-ligase adenylyltransferase
MRLRPSGRSGTLVTSLSGFFEYQLNSAWTWEHQALVRSRVVVGNKKYRQNFESSREAILSLSREHKQLKSDIISMRRKMIDANCQSTDRVYDIKLDEGGIVDIEFLVQYWVLRHAGQHKVLAAPRTTEDSLAALVSESIISARTGQQLLECYKIYLRHSLDLKLMDQPVLVLQDELLPQRKTIRAIWDETFS